MILFSQKNKILIIATFLGFMLFFARSSATIAITSSISINEVTIDGKWTTPHEWEDATKFSLKRGNEMTQIISGYFCIKDDKNFLYILIDYISDKNIDKKDVAKICLDTNNDKANAPKFDDYMIGLDWSTGNASGIIWKGNGNNWALEKKIQFGFEVASTNDAEKDPYLKLPHLIYEFAISRELFKNSSIIGFCAFAEDKNSRMPTNLLFPKTFQHVNPSTWANLALEAKSEVRTLVPTLQPNTTSALTPSIKTHPKTTIEPSPMKESLFKDTPSKVQTILEDVTPYASLVKFFFVVMIILAVVNYLKSSINDKSSAYKI
ncbi:MAG: hypothetical protein NWE86_06355 [Candidatus Bathyarchaeota archaeon]|nr:hypothetical protein [Candidatus Bathyarchaeota archaeon]